MTEGTFLEVPDPGVSSYFELCWSLSDHSVGHQGQQMFAGHEMGCCETPSLSACDLFVTNHCDPARQSGKDGLTLASVLLGSVQSVILDPNASLFSWRSEK